MISQNQSGFKLGDLSINQVLAIINLDVSFKQKERFLIFLKFLTEKWHEAVIYKIKQYDNSNDVFVTLVDTLTEYKAST